MAMERSVDARYFVLTGMVECNVELYSSPYFINLKAVNNYIQT